MVLRVPVFLREKVYEVPLRQQSPDEISYRFDSVN